jgi:hypothetical protein
LLPAGVYRLEAAAAAREALMREARWEMLLACQNERHIFLIDNTAVVAFCHLRKSACSDEIPALFLVGKDSAGAWRCPDVPGLALALRRFDESALLISYQTIRRLAPATLSPPEFRDARDATLFRKLAAFEPLGEPTSGWTPEFGREIDSTGDSDLFRDEEWLMANGAQRSEREEWRLDGRRIVPVIGGRQIAQYQYGFTPIDRWCFLNEAEERITADPTTGLRSHDGVRIAFRDVSKTGNMRTMIAALVPRDHIARHAAPYVRAGSISATEMIMLVGLFNSFCFDYFMRTLGFGRAQFASLRQIRVPPPSSLQATIADALAATRPEWLRKETISEVGTEASALEWWRARAEVDALIADAYGLSLEDYFFVLSRFPLLDLALGRSMWTPLEGEARSTITRDVALLAYARLRGTDDIDLLSLASESGIQLPLTTCAPLGLRVATSLELGAVPYSERPKSAYYVEWSAEYDDESDEAEASSE